MRAWFLRGLAAFAVIFAVVAWLHGTQSTVSIEQRPASVGAAAAAPGEAGMRVSIDPETGELAPATAAQQKALDQEMQQMLSRSSEGLVEEVLPNGAVQVHLQGRFQSASVAVIDETGTLHTGCVDNHDSCRAAVNGAVAKARALEEK
jgi:DNA-binding protein YbaB